MISTAEARKRYLKESQQRIAALEEKLAILRRERNSLIAEEEEERFATHGLTHNQIIIVSTEIKDWFFRDTSMSRYHSWVDKPFMVGTEAIISSTINSNDKVRLRSSGWEMSFSVDMIVQAATNRSV